MLMTPSVSGSTLFARRCACQSTRSATQEFRPEAGNEQARSQSIAKLTNHPIIGKSGPSRLFRDPSPVPSGIPEEGSVTVLGGLSFSTLLPEQNSLPGPSEPPRRKPYQKVVVHGYHRPMQIQSPYRRLGAHQHNANFLNMPLLCSFLTADGDSEACRSAFRTDVDHDSEVMAISVPN